MRWKAVLVLACGCGRIGFDAASDAAGDGDRDAPDGAVTICHTGTWGAPTAVANINTLSEEADPSLSPDELTLYFTSNRNGGQGRAIWQATRDSRADAFATPMLVAAVDSVADDSEPEISPDGLTLYFASIRSGADNLYIATRPSTTSPFTLQGIVSVLADGATIRSGPSVTDDELTLLYTHDALDVAIATRSNPAVDFTFVRELTELNAPQSDGSPSITGDGLELFFDSYRDGLAEIVAASRASVTDSFSAPIVLTSFVGDLGEGTPEISADGRTLYFFANVGGQLDLYAVTRSCP